MSYIGYHPTELTIGETHTVRPGETLFDQTIWQHPEDRLQLAPMYARELAECVDDLGAVLFVGPAETSGVWITALLALTCLVNIEMTGGETIRCVVLDVVEGNARVLLATGLNPVRGNLIAHTEASKHLTAECGTALYVLTEQYGIVGV